MKKIKITSIVILSLTLIYYLSNLTGVLVFYKISTSVNSPTIKVDSYVISTNLITPSKKDFITFSQSDTIFGEQAWLQRLCAIEKDTVLMKNGVLFVNGENFDKNLNLVNFYTVDKSLFDDLYKSKKLINHFMTTRLNENRIKVLLDKETASIYNLKFDPNIEPVNLINGNNTQSNWTKHNFGPIVIPKNKLLVLADNRDWYNDSRTLGLVNKSKLLGVVINK